MNWLSWSDFIRMGGYGGYVWGSLGVMALALAIEVWQIAARRSALHHIDDGGGFDEAED